MAHHLSAKTRIRRNARRAVINGSRRSRTRTLVRQFEEAVASGNKDAAKTALVTAEAEMQRAVNKKVYHKNTVARKVSRMAKRVKAMA